jgi:hypothetical protein
MSVEKKTERFTASLMDTVSITALPSAPTSNQVMQPSRQPATTATAFSIPPDVFLRWHMGRCRSRISVDTSGDEILLNEVERISY